LNIAVRQSPADEACIGLNAAEVNALRANDWFNLLPRQLQRALLQHCAIWHVPAHLGRQRQSDPLTSRHTVGP
jgi:hypothetical protein